MAVYGLERAGADGVFPPASVTAIVAILAILGQVYSAGCLQHSGERTSADSLESRWIRASDPGSEALSGVLMTIDILRIA